MPAITEEAKVWQDWLMRVIAGAPDQLQTMYSVMGDKRLDEIELPHLAGYENSRPVRIGNAAAQQLQLDIYGELADVHGPGAQGRPAAAAAARRNPPGLPGASGKDLEQAGRRHLGNTRRAAAFRPFQGDDLGGVRPRRQNPRSRASANRRVTAASPTKIHKDICAKGVDKKRGCFVQAYGSERMDASLLLLPHGGFPAGQGQAHQQTVAEIEKRLLRKGLVLRYETETGVDGLPPGEGAFLACSFWLADNYLLLGRVADARRLFNRLKKLSNDVGLFAEEYDPVAKRMLGNFPQAFSHVALINTRAGSDDAGRKTWQENPQTPSVRY